MRKVRKLCLVLIASLGAVVSFTPVSCTSSDDGGDESKVVDDSELRKNTYYTVSDPTSGWEEGMYYNSCFVMAHRNQEDGTLLYYLNDTKSEQQDGVLMEFDEEGNVTAFGYPGNVAVVCEMNGKNYLSKATDISETRYAEIESDLTAKTPSVDVTNGKLIGAFVDMTDVQSGQSWVTSVFGPLKKAFGRLNASNGSKKSEKWMQARVQQLAKGRVQEGTNMTFLNISQNSMTEDYDYLRRRARFATIGGATPEIIDVVNRQDGTTEVTVRIRETNSIPLRHKNVVIAPDGTQTTVSAENDICCGVLVRKDGTPLRTHYDACTDELVIKRSDIGSVYADKGGERDVTFVLSLGTEDVVALRPYVMAHLDGHAETLSKRKTGAMNYGKARPFLAANIDVSYTVESARATVYSVRDKDVYYELAFRANAQMNLKSNAISITDWGVVIEQGDSTKEVLSFTEDQKTSDYQKTISLTARRGVTFYLKELELKPTVHHAYPKDCKMKPYVTYCLSDDYGKEYTTYGEAKDFAPMYNQMPAIELVEAKYDKTFSTGSTVSVTYYDKFISSYVTRDVDILLSTNTCRYTIHGALFSDSLVVRQTGLGWDKKCMTYAVKQFGEASRKFGYFKDGILETDIDLEFREDSVTDNPSRYLNFDLWESGRAIFGKNKIAYRARKKDNYGANVYHIIGFEAYLKEQ